MHWVWDVFGSNGLDTIRSLTVKIYVETRLFIYFPLFSFIFLVYFPLFTLHLNILTSVFKAINRLSPSCFHNYFQPNSNIHKIGTRQLSRSDLYKTVKNTTTYGLKSVHFLVLSCGNICLFSFVLLVQLLLLCLN